MKRRGVHHSVLQFLINTVFSNSAVKFSDQQNAYARSTSKVHVYIAHNAEADSLMRSFCIWMVYWGLFHRLAVIAQ